MMSQEELLPWTEPDTNFFEDNLLGIEDWGDSLTDINLGENDVLLGNNDQDMDVNPDDLSELLQNIGDDMWAISEDTVQTLGAQIKQEPPSPSSSTSSLISLDSSLPSSPESQLLTNGQCSPIHRPNYTKIEPAAPVQPIKREPNLQVPLTCIRTDANLVLPLSELKTVPSVIKTEVAVTPSCLIKKEPITIQPCSLVKPLPNIPAGHVQKITIQNGQQPKILQQAKGVQAVSTAGNITYIPVPGTIPTTALLVGNKATLPISKPISSVVANGVTTMKTTQANCTINDKVMKRQQRMIKNRESACLSRKKKKEYLQSLEGKIREVTQLNDKLNQENMKLKHRVTELEKENLLLKNNHPNWSSTAKKSTCVLAVVLLVALNIGSFSSLKNPWNFNSPDNLLSVHHGRALLQYEEAKSGENTKPLVYGPLRKQYAAKNDDSLGTKPKDTIINVNTERKDLIVVKKKWDFLSDMNKKKAILAKKERRRKNSLKRMNRLYNKTRIIEGPMCTTPHVNATESLRLNEVLGEWIHKYQTDRTMRKKKQATPPKRFKSVKELALRLTPNCSETEARRRIQRHMFSRRHNAEPSASKNAVQLFQGVDWLKMFSEAINRQDDTMYIVSFRQDHLVFPATKSNVTERPKVSLMMMAPSNGTTVNVTKDQESISMIQIDCQVMDTKHINIKKSSLPKPFGDYNTYRPASSKAYSQPSADHTPSIPTRNAK